MLLWGGVEVTIYQAGFSFYRMVSEMPESLQLIALGCLLLTASSLGKKAIRWEASQKTDSKPASPAALSLPSAAVLQSERHAGA